ncbi:MAG: peptidylprolyl isomerase [Calditrichia bacterium]
MMGQLRNMTKWVLYILIFAFLALMVFEWGADGSMFTGGQYVGEIEGEDIALKDYQEAVREAYNNELYRTGQQPQQERATALRNQVWEQLVRSRVLTPVVEEMGIDVTSADITNFIINNPPPDLRQSEQLQTNGVFDIEKYKQLLAVPENRSSLVIQENLLRRELPFIKLEEIISASAVITEAEIRDEFMAQSMKSKIDFMLVPLSSFRDKPVEVTDTDIAGYYNENRKEYKVDEKRKLNYVFFSSAATKADTAQVFNTARGLIQQANEGKDFAELARLYSIDTSNKDKGGDLGYFDRSRMVKPFSDAAFDAEVGSIVGPIETRFGIHIIKVTDRRTTDGKEETQASHILLEIGPSTDTIDLANGKANDFLDALVDRDFSVAADEMGFEIKQTPDFTNNNNGTIPGVGRAGQGAVAWAFNEPIGEHSRIYETGTGYAILEVADITPEGVRPLKDVTATIKNQLEAINRRAMTMEYAKTIAGQINKSTDFLQFRDNSDLTLVADTTGWFAMQASVPKVGRAPSVAAAAFNLGIGEVSGPLATDRGTFFIRVRDRQEFDEAAYATQRSAIRDRLTQQKRRGVFTSWYEQLKDEADIKDYRYRFFTI